MDLYQGLKSPPIFWPILRSLQAGVCGLVGKPEQGLVFIDEALANQRPGDGEMLAIEFYRLKGDMLLALSPDDQTKAELWYRRSLETAKELGAIMQELRAAISLARLWRNQDGWQILSEAYAKFSEGFTTVDLMEAKDLLGALSD
jgi:hypothetical protein